MSQHIYDMLIIGGGPAGYTAALYAARAGLDTLVLERMTVGGQMAITDTIDNYPGFPNGIDGFTLGFEMQKGAERFGAVTEYADVIGAELVGDIKTVYTASKDYKGRTVVIATGAAPRELGLPKEKEYLGRGVHYCAHCDGRFYKGKTVVVVGGGNSAAADALYLSRLAEKVIVVHRRNELRATKVYHKPLQNAENVEFKWNSVSRDLVVEDDKVCGLTVVDNITGKEEQIKCDAVFVSIGRVPVSDVLGDRILRDEAGYIVSDETTKTNIDGVYAVGDARTKPLRQIVTAVADGAVAVHFAEEYLAEHSGDRE